MFPICCDSFTHTKLPQGSPLSWGFGMLLSMSKQVKPPIIQQVIKFPYLESGKLTNMSQRHGRIGDTLGDKQI